MTTSERSWGPVSQPLVDELRDLVAAKTMVVWLDKAGHYTEFFDGLGDDPRALGATLVGYRGSYLELLARLAELTDGPNERPLVVHVPGANKESIKNTPLLQLYAVSHAYERSLDTLVRNASAGRVPADEVDEFLHGSPHVTLGSADAWLAMRSATAGDVLAAELRAKKPGPLIAELLHRRDPSTDERRPASGHAETIRHAFAARFGLPEGWPGQDSASREPRRIAEIAAQWVMAVEYVNDLLKPPIAQVLAPARKVTGALRDACRDAAGYLRQHLPEDYGVLAHDFEERLDEERQRPADELGRIDTFSFEEDRLLLDALDGLRTGDWARAQRWADERIDGRSVWLTLDPSRNRTWRLVQRCAALGQAIEQSTADKRLAFDAMYSLDEASLAYAEHGAPVDRLHRVMMQSAATDLLERLPHESQVRAAVRKLERAWRDWGEARARAWTAITEREGALPSSSRRQRGIFDEVVAPLLVDGGRVAYFMVDALRYEMATELVDLLNRPTGSKVHLDARLAELPSVTEVGMNLLAPMVRKGRLQPRLNADRKAFTGWSDGGAHVSSPAHRLQAIAARVPAGAAKPFTLEQVIAYETPGALKRSIGKAQLVVVHSTKIDKAGENRSGLAEFSRELRRLEKARQLLHAAGVHRFVVTADHGFLLRDPTEEGIPFGKAFDSKGRYALYGQPQNDESTYSVSLTSLDYDDGRTDVLVFPRGLTAFAVAQDRDFVHGGNSPQERVIPVLTIEHRLEQGGADVHYRIEIEGHATDTAAHRLTARIVRADNQVSMALAGEPVLLELRAVGSGIRAELVDAEHGKLEGGMVTVTTGESFSLSFTLTGPREQRVPVRLICGTARIRVDEVVSPARFDVAVLRSKHPTGEIRAIQTSEPETPAETTSPDVLSDAWLDAYDMPLHRKAMAHIATHGEATESDLLMLLGSSREIRKFSKRFEEYAARAPFVMKISYSPAGKIYQRLTDA